MTRNFFLFISLVSMFAYSCQSDTKTESVKVEHPEKTNAEAVQKPQNSRTISSQDIQSQKAHNSNRNKAESNQEEKYFLKVNHSGRSKTYSAPQAYYKVDAKTGKTTFDISGQKIVFPDLMRNVRLRGRDSLLDKPFIMLLPGISNDAELSCTIRKLGAKVPTGTSGYNQDIEGEFTGEAEGSFRLQSFTPK